MFVLFCRLTRPQVQTIEPVRAQVVADSVWPPAVTSCRRGVVTCTTGPTHPQVSRLRCHKRLRPLHHHLVIPLSVVGGVVSHAEVNVWANTDTKHTPSFLDSASVGKITHISPVMMWITWKTLTVSCYTPNRHMRK